MEQDLAVVVNDEFSEMLRRIAGRGVFGESEGGDLECFKAISAETAMRIFVFGLSCGRQPERAKE